ncbi:MAG TPA: hypothetical protein VHU82_04270 [Vicinamibacterales bacterium]|nr:hypothetical protein [Vicinamibacterales bacterium]
MRAYARVDEERVHGQAQVRRWMRAGLLSPSQGAELEADLRVDLRRTNRALRVGLALFTAMIVAASVLWVVTFFDIGGRWAIAAIDALAALACVAIAERAVSVLRFYRHGVEEALFAAAVVLLSISAIEIPALDQDGRAVCALAIGAAGGFLTYRRLGLVAAAIAGMACAAGIPFQLHLAPNAQSALATATLVIVFRVMRAKRLGAVDDVQGEEYAALQAASWFGVYLAVNIQAMRALDLFGPGAAPVRDWFFWGTFAGIWILPVVGLRLGIRAKDRPLIDVSLMMAVVTCASVKPYLGWTREPWDPVVLGTLLIGGAVVLRRWLASGPNGERFGFTPVRRLESNRDLATLIGVASAGFQPHGAAPPAAPPSDFAGGRSGGGGGGAGF